MNKKSENILMLALGLCLGTIVGLLCAPTKGAMVRSGLLYNLKTCQERIKFLLKRLISTKNSLSNQAKNTGQGVILEAVAAAETILKELDTLADQLDGKKKEEPI